MKKVMLFLLILIPFKVYALSAESSIVMDTDNGRILHANNIDKKHLIASISKIMTAIVTIECANLDKEVVVGEEILKAHGSAIYVEIGEKLKLRDLLMGLMLRSGNDAAEVIAKNVAGSMENFAILMNEFAKKIGMNNTIFYNASGLEENDGLGNISTARDMALLTKYAMQNNTFKEIFGTKKYVLKTNYKTYSWVSKNKLIHTYDFITGGKTGYTKKAHRTLVTTATSNDVNLVIVTLDDGFDFLDHIELYKKAFKEYSGVKILDKNKIKIKNEENYKKDTLYLNEDIIVPLTDSERNKISIKYELYQFDKYLDGDKVGYVNVFLENELITKREIYVKKCKDKKSSSWWKSFLRWLGW